MTRKNSANTRSVSPSMWVHRSLFAISLCLLVTVLSADQDFDAGVTLETSTPRFDVVVFGGATDAAGLERIVSEKDAVWERVREFLGDRARKLPRGRLVLYPRISDKGTFANDTRIAHTDAATHESHLALEDGLASIAWDTETVALLRSALGEPRTRALEVGLGVRLSTSWGRRGWAYWAARYQAAEMVPPLGELLDNDLLDPGLFHFIEYLIG